MKGTPAQTGPHRLRSVRKFIRAEAAFPILILLVFTGGLSARQFLRARADAPSSAERIYATLVEWGADASGLVPPADDAEIDRRVAQLWNSDGEVRVRAARWLAMRGLRDTGDEIAASMADPDTQRPCQLAHSLGKLGDEQWVDELLVAATQPENTDLRTCATIALADIASPRSVDALIELTREDPSRVFAVRALGETGDRRALEHLRRLLDEASRAPNRRTIELAIERVELLSQADPWRDLVRHFEESARRGRIDEWTLRHLVRLNDPRSIEPIARQFTAPAHSRRTREILAAALLAHGTDGQNALDIASRSAGHPSVYEVAQIALSLRSQREPSSRLAASTDESSRSSDIH